MTSAKVSAAMLVAANHDALIARMRARAMDPKRIRDMFPSMSILAASVSAAEISEAQQRLGMKLPPLLVRLYTEVGNGGFGPGYGLYGLIGGAAGSNGERALSLWDDSTSLDQDARFQAWRYPRTLLPLMTWGCAIYSCVDLADPSLLVSRFEPGWFVEVGDGDDEDPDNPPTTPDEFAELFDREAPLVEWLESWLAGTLEQ